MAKTPSRPASPQAPTPRDLRSTQPVPTAPPPEANEKPKIPESPVAADQQKAEIRRASERVAAPKSDGNVQQADVRVEASTGADPRTQGAPAAPEPPEPPPSIDKNVMARQARTYINDAVTLSGRHLSPTDSSTIDQLISIKFDSGTVTPEELAEQVAQEVGLEPTWTEDQGIRMLSISKKA